MPGFVYLGLPIGDSQTVAKWLEDKFRKVERAFFAIRKIGLHAGLIHPLALGYIYRQYCQSIFLYGLELLPISKGTLHSFDSRQCLLLKLGLGLSKYSRNTALIESLEIRSISEQYYLHKLLFRNQINTNSLARAVFDRLIETSYPSNRDMTSFLNQLKYVNRLLEIDALVLPLKQAREKLRTKFKPVFMGVVDSLKHIYYNWWSDPIPIVCSTCF